MSFTLLSSILASTLGGISFCQASNYAGGRQKDAIASSDITKAPIVKRLNAKVTLRQIV